MTKFRHRMFQIQQFEFYGICEKAIFPLTSMVTSPKNCQKIFHNFLKNCSVKTYAWNSMKLSCLLLYSFTFQMTPKILKYVDQVKQDKFSCKRENTCKSMEFSKRDEYFCPPTVSGTYTMKTNRKQNKQLFSQ